MQRLPISDKTRKLLWGRSASRCAICHCELAQHPSSSSAPTIIGEEAHIVAQKTGGARGTELPLGGDIDGYDNLVLLCRNDHRLIDDQPEVYPTIRLVEIKREHESWVREVLEEADGLAPSNAPRAIQRLMRESEARCIERWQALGLSLVTATELARDAAVGAPPDLDRTNRPVVVLVGDAGSGKSLAGERIHQSDLRSSLGDTSAPTPIWIRARETPQGLQEAVDERLRRLGRRSPDAVISLVIDGLDELGPAGAATLLSEVRRVIQNRPGSRALATTRLLDAIGNTDERSVLDPLSDDEAVALIERVSGVQSISLFRFSESINDAARRPLFAIALGRLLADQPAFTPATPAEVIDGMVRAAVGESWRDLRPSLIALAIVALRRDGGAVRAADIVPAHQLEQLLKTRLVVEERGRLRFPLVVFAQWFASDAILGGDVDIEGLLDEPQDLELWRYPLAVAVARASQQQAGEILTLLAERNAAFASVIVGETVRQHGANEESDVGTWREAGEAIRKAESAWVSGLGPLAEQIAPIDATDHLQPLGVSMLDARMTTAWYWGSEEREELFELDPGFFVLSAPPGYGPSRSGRPPAGPAWAWRWTRDELAKGVERLLAERQLVLAGSPLEHEAVWTTALLALNRGSLTSDPIDVTWLLDLDADVDAIANGVRPVPVAGLVSLLTRYADHNGMLAPPWPGPDRDIPGSWVWSCFSQEQVRQRAEAIFTTALRAYQHFTETLFASLAPRMRMAATMPAVARGTVSFSDRTDVAGAPQVQWRLEPIESEDSHAELSLGVWGDPLTGFEDLTDTLKVARPRAARWIYAVAHNGVLNIFNTAPAAQLTYRWLWEDLKAIGWVEGLPSPSWPTGRAPRLR